MVLLIISLSWLQPLPPHSYGCGCSPLPQRLRAEIKVRPHWKGKGYRDDSRITEPANEPPDNLSLSPRTPKLSTVAKTNIFLNIPISK